MGDRYEKPTDNQAEEDEPLLPLDDRFRLAEQDTLDLYPDDEEEKEKKKWRRLIRLMWS